MLEQSSTLPPSQAPAALPVIRKSAAPLRRQVLEELRQSIIAGRLAPGARLIERELIAMMGVSRTVIREALRQLESEGLIAIIPNKGPVVRELTLDEAKDLYSIRAVLEGLAARLFAENADDAQVRKLELALQATGEAYKRREPELILEAKNHFYDVLFEGAGSETLSSMIGTLHVRIWRWRALGLSHPQSSTERSKESMEGLRGMLVAIKERDASLAEKSIRAEVTKAAEEVMRLLGDGKSAGPGNAISPS
jgi:GntR family transcriptional regulator, trigonelline degradation regulator